jgi:hypothetical protein
MSIPWVELLLFMAAVALLALYGLSVSGHFPADLRAAEFRAGLGAITMWITIAIAGLATVVVIGAAWSVLPWYAAAIGGGAMLLIAPLILQAFPDRFVNGRSALIAFAAGSASAALMLWARAVHI